MCITTKYLACVNNNGPNSYGLLNENPSTGHGVASYRLLVMSSGHDIVLVHGYGHQHKMYARWSQSTLQHG